MNPETSNIKNKKSQSISLSNNYSDLLKFISTSKKMTSNIKTDNKSKYSIINSNVSSTEISNLNNTTNHRNNQSISYQNNLINNNFNVNNSQNTHTPTNSILNGYKLKGILNKQKNSSINNSLNFNNFDKHKKHISILSNSSFKSSNLNTEPTSIHYNSIIPNKNNNPSIISPDTNYQLNNSNKFSYIQSPVFQSSKKSTLFPVKELEMNTNHANMKDSHDNISRNTINDDDQSNTYKENSNYHSFMRNHNIKKSQKSQLDTLSFNYNNINSSNILNTQGEDDYNYTINANNSISSKFNINNITNTDINNHNTINIFKKTSKLNKNSNQTLNPNITNKYKLDLSQNSLNLMRDSIKNIKTTSNIRKHSIIPNSNKNINLLKNSLNTMLSNKGNNYSIHESIHTLSPNTMKTDLSLNFNNYNKESTKLKNRNYKNSLINSPSKFHSPSRLIINTRNINTHNSKSNIKNNQIIYDRQDKHLNSIKTINTITSNPSPLTPGIRKPQASNYNNIKLGNPTIYSTNSQQTVSVNNSTINNQINTSNYMNFLRKSKNNLGSTIKSNNNNFITQSEEIKRKSFLSIFKNLGLVGVLESKNYIKDQERNRKNSILINNNSIINQINKRRSTNFNLVSPVQSRKMSVFNPSINLNFLQNKPNKNKLKFSVDRKHDTLSPEAIEKTRRFSEAKEDLNYNKNNSYKNFNQGNNSITENSNLSSRKESELDREDKNDKSNYPQYLKFLSLVQLATKQKRKNSLIPHSYLKDTAENNYKLIQKKISITDKDNDQLRKVIKRISKEDLKKNIISLKNLKTANTMNTMNPTIKAINHSSNSNNKYNFKPNVTNINLNIYNNNSKNLSKVIEQLNKKEEENNYNNSRLILQKQYSFIEHNENPVPSINNSSINDEQEENYYSINNTNLEKNNKANRDNTQLKFLNTLEGKQENNIFNELNLYNNSKKVNTLESVESKNNEFSGINSSSLNSPYISKSNFRYNRKSNQNVNVINDKANKVSFQSLFDKKNTLKPSKNYKSSKSLKINNNEGKNTSHVNFKKIDSSSSSSTESFFDNKSKGKNAFRQTIKKQLSIRTSNLNTNNNNEEVENELIPISIISNKDLKLNQGFKDDKLNILFGFDLSSNNLNRPFKRQFSIFNKKSNFDKNNEAHGTQKKNIKRSMTVYNSNDNTTSNLGRRSEFSNDSVNFAQTFLKKDNSNKQTNDSIVTFSNNKNKNNFESLKNINKLASNNNLDNSNIKIIDKQTSRINTNTAGLIKSIDNPSNNRSIPSSFSHKEIVFKHSSSNNNNTIEDYTVKIDYIDNKADQQNYNNFDLMQYSPDKGKSKYFISNKSDVNNGTIIETLNAFNNSKNSDKDFKNKMKSKVSSNNTKTIFSTNNDLFKISESVDEPYKINNKKQTMINSGTNNSEEFLNESKDIVNSSNLDEAHNISKKYSSGNVLNLLNRAFSKRNTLNLKNKLKFQATKEIKTNIDDYKLNSKNAMKEYESKRTFLIPKTNIKLTSKDSDNDESRANSIYHESSKSFNHMESLNNKNGLKKQITKKSWYSRTELESIGEDSIFSGLSGKSIHLRENEEYYEDESFEMEQQGNYIKDFTHRIISNILEFGFLQDQDKYLIQNFYNQVKEENTKLKKVINTENQVEKEREIFMMDLELNESKISKDSCNNNQHLIFNYYSSIKRSKSMINIKNRFSLIESEEDIAIRNFKVIDQLNNSFSFKYFIEPDLDLNGKQDDEEDKNIEENYFSKIIENNKSNNNLKKDNLKQTKNDSNSRRFNLYTKLHQLYLHRKNMRLLYYNEVDKQNKKTEIDQINYKIHESNVQLLSKSSQYMNSHSLKLKENLFFQSNDFFNDVVKHELNASVKRIRLRKLVSMFKGMFNNLNVFEREEFKPIITSIKTILGTSVNWIKYINKSYFDVYNCMAALLSMFKTKKTKFKNEFGLGFDITRETFQQSNVKKEPDTKSTNFNFTKPKEIKRDDTINTNNNNMSSYYNYYYNESFKNNFSHSNFFESAKNISNRKYFNINTHNNEYFEDNNYDSDESKGSKVIKGFRTKTMGSIRNKFASLYQKRKKTAKFGDNSIGREDNFNDKNKNSNDIFDNKGNISDNILDNELMSFSPSKANSINKITANKEDLAGSSYKIAPFSNNNIKDNNYSLFKIPIDLDNNNGSPNFLYDKHRCSYSYNKTCKNKYISSFNLNDNKNEKENSSKVINSKNLIKKISIIPEEERFKTFEEVCYYRNHSVSNKFDDLDLNKKYGIKIKRSKTPFLDRLIKLNKKVNKDDNQIFNYEVDFQALNKRTRKNWIRQSEKPKKYFIKDYDFFMKSIIKEQQNIIGKLKADKIDFKSPDRKDTFIEKDCNSPSNGLLKLKSRKTSIINDYYKTRSLNDSSKRLINKYSSRYSMNKKNSYSSNSNTNTISNKFKNNYSSKSLKNVRKKNEINTKSNENISELSRRSFLVHTRERNNSILLKNRLELLNSNRRQSNINSFNRKDNNSTSVNPNKVFMNSKTMNFTDKRDKQDENCLILQKPGKGTYFQFKNANLRDKLKEFNSNNDSSYNKNNDSSRLLRNNSIQWDNQESQKNSNRSIVANTRAPKRSRTNLGMKEFNSKLSLNKMMEKLKNNEVKEKNVIIAKEETNTHNNLISSINNKKLSKEQYDSDFSNEKPKKRKTKKIKTLIKSTEAEFNRNTLRLLSQGMNNSENFNLEKVKNNIEKRKSDMENNDLNKKISNSQLKVNEKVINRSDKKLSNNLTSSISPKIYFKQHSDIDDLSNTNDLNVDSKKNSDIKEFNLHSTSNYNHISNVINEDSSDDNENNKTKRKQKVKFIESNAVPNTNRNSTNINNNTNSDVMYNLYGYSSLSNRGNNNKQVNPVKKTSFNTITIKLNKEKLANLNLNKEVLKGVQKRNSISKLQLFPFSGKRNYDPNNNTSSLVSEIKNEEEASNTNKAKKKTTAFDFIKEFNSNIEKSKIHVDDFSSDNEAHMMTNNLNNFKIKSYLKKKHEMLSNGNNITETEFSILNNTALVKDVFFKRNIKYNKLVARMAKTIMNKSKLQKSISPVKVFTDSCKKSGKNKDKSDHKEKNLNFVYNRADIEEYKWTGVMTQASFGLRTHNFKSKTILQMNENTMDKIIFYIKDCSFAEFKELLEKTKVDIENKDEDGNNLLNHAAQANSYNICEYLLNYGADINTQNASLNTPLHYALVNRNFKLSNLFINRNANQMLKNNLGMNAWENYFASGCDNNYPN